MFPGILSHFLNYAEAPVASASLMRRALEYSKMFDRVIMQHCQVPELTVGGVMNEGFESMRLGLGGMPAAAEDIMVARDIRLAEITGGRLHIQHISTARSVELVRCTPRPPTCKRALVSTPSSSNNKFREFVW